jgi:hypothetical protein
MGEFKMRAVSLVAGLSAMSLLAGFGSSLFAADAGTIQQLSGNVTITGADSVTRKAAPKDRVQAGDTIATEVKSETLIKLADDSTVVLRPNTQFQIAEFKYDKAPADSSIMKLLRGTARMVTGLIARRVPANYRVSTPTATIGVRGTDFEVAVVPEDTSEARAGVYDFVREGATNIQLVQSGQSLDVKKNQTAFAPDKLKPGEEPLQILRETPIFLQSGGGLDAIIQSITIQVPMFR